MGWISDMNEKIKRGIRSWLQIMPSSPYNIQIQELADFELSAIRNRIWYRGDGNELEQMYLQCQEYADKYKFWASRCTPGLEIRKIHTGIPSLIVKTLAAITLADMNDFDFAREIQRQTWQKIEEENHFQEMIEEALRDVLVVGDGAFRIIMDTEESEYPIIEWIPGERTEYVYRYGRLKEIIIKTLFRGGHVLYAHYGKGYIRHELYKGEQLVDIKTFPETAGLSDWSFEKSLMLAVPLKLYESAKFVGRGGSVFDGKLDSFDALDETWSQWMDALRAGRAKTYVPESFIPRDPESGKLLRPNAFDNRFIAGDVDMRENGKNEVTVSQPSIPHDSYLASYVTALDLCLQGIISPSTLGIDMKKLDNAEAQREKEKTTLYTRAAIVKAIQEQLPHLISACLNAEHVLRKEAVEEVKVTIPFGEYANPSFESQIETLAKARPGVAMMSIEAQIEELYGDSKDQSWKEEEVMRLKAEQGVAEMDDPAMGAAAMDLAGGLRDESKSNEPPVQDESPGVSGAAQNSGGTGAVGSLRTGKG